MAFKHGIYTTESPTAIVPPVNIESGLIFCVGISASHLATKPAKPNTPTLIYELSEYVEKFGYSGDFKNFTNDEAASSQFQLFGMSPIVFVNVLNPEKHFEKVTKTVGGITSTPATITDAVISDTLKIISRDDLKKINLIKDTDYTADVQTTTDGDVTTIDIKVGAILPSDNLEISYEYNGDICTVEKSVASLPYELPAGATNIDVKALVQNENELIRDTDYTAAYNSDAEFIITILDATKIFKDTVEISYNKLAPEKVTPSDIIGGYDSISGKYTGLECIEQVFPKFRLTPGIIIAPKFSTDVTVAAIMKAKTYNINGVFNCIALCDLPTDTIKNYTDAAEYKNIKNLLDTNLIACYPKISLGGVQYHLSTQLASLMNKVDENQGDGIPYVSPSNKNLQMDSCCLEDGEEIFYSLEQANYLNSQGISTALNFANGWTFWGNRTSLYPSSTDTKDTFTSIRRTFHWLRNTIILTYFSKVDAPINRRLIESIQDSIQIWLNGLTAKGVCTGARIEFRTKENPTTSLLDGQITFKIYFSPAIPAEKIIFDVEFDPSYLNNLFE